jgi:ABC-2 type transport system ATP-binding protein
VVDLNAPLPAGFTLPGATVTAVQADGHRVSFSLESASAGPAVAHLMSVASVRDLSLVEPGIEDVVARLYAASSALA